MKSIKQEFKDKGIFYTPKELAYKLKQYAKEKPLNVYDPTCGDGALLSVFDDDIPKYGQEINGEQIENANINLKNFTGYCGDTLKDPHFKDMKFDCIVANPPFSIAWEPLIDWRFENAPTIPSKSKADYAFILHILSYLAVDGVAVVLNFPGILYRGNREGMIRRWLVDTNKIDKIVYIAEDTFVDTKISTVMLVLRHNKTNTDITVIDDKTGEEKTITIDDVKKCDYSLSSNNFFETVIVRENIDPVELEMSARKQCLKRLEFELEMSIYASKQENIDIEPFLKDIESVVENARVKYLGMEGLDES